MRKDEEHDVDAAFRRRAHRLAREYEGRAPSGPKELAEANLRLVWAVANRIRRRPGISFDEAVAMGNVGLARAAGRYDPAIGAFSTLACLSIRHAILRELEAGPELAISTPTGILNRSAASRAKSPVAAEAYRYILDLRRRIVEGAIERAEDGAPPLMRIASREESQEERAQRAEAIALVRRMVDRLPERERTVILLHLEGQDDVAIAKACGRSKTTIFSTRQRARERLARMLARYQEPAS